MCNILNKNCKKHGLTEFKLIGNSNKSYCILCKNEQHKHRKYAQKIKAINYLGNKCCKCNETFDDISVYSFYSLSYKKIGSLLTNSFEKVKHLFEDCKLYCNNCLNEYLSEDEINQINNDNYNVKYNRIQRNEQKLKVIEILGGSCLKCKYNNSVRSLHPHHLFDKNFAIGGNGHLKNWDLILEEIKKCILLCSNCHSKEHSDFKNHDKELLQKYL